jgi:hypothetical protein
MPRVLLNFEHYGNAWTVHFIEGDCPTTIGPRTSYFNFPSLIAFVASLPDAGLRMRPSSGSITVCGRGSEYVHLTLEQYEKLR